MGKLLPFSTVLSLFLLVPASIIWGQKINVNKGILTTEFALAQGNVTIYLPSDIRPGDIISGTIIVSPEGRNERLQKTNLEKMLGSTLELFSAAIKLEKAEQPFKLNIPAQLSSVIDWKQASGQSLSASIPSTVFSKKIPVTDRCVFPSHVLTESVFYVVGPFDGDIMNTSGVIAETPLKMLAESPRQCIASWPANAKGQKQCSITENGKTCTEPVSGVDMIVTTGKLNLRRGESTYIDVKLTGLQSLPDKAVLTVTNLSQEIVTMVNGNTQVIPIWPLADSAEGSVSFHFPAASIAVGNFNVNLNLELPDNIRIYSTSEEEVPAGYTRKTCDCSVTATIRRTGNSFSVQANGTCAGAHGIGIQTFERCKTAYIGYDWQVTSGAENAEVSGPNNTSNFTVRTKNNGQYIICVVVTVVCIDGTTCTTTQCMNQEGSAVPAGTTVRDPKPPTVTGDPTVERPPPSKCSCYCTVAITALGAAGKNFNYSAAANAQCTGSSGTGATRVRCSVTSVSYIWNILTGGASARIKGAANLPGVIIERDNTQPFTLQVVALVTCSDGSTCRCSAVIEVGGNSKTCSPVVTEIVEPRMNGGFIKAHYGISGKNPLPRDEFIILQAEATDWDQVEFRCNPSKPDCPDEPSLKRFGVEGRVAYQWRTPKGSFVKLGCLPDDSTATGERVIFKPPVIPLPVRRNDTTVSFKINLQIIDDGSAITDPPQNKEIDVEIKRSKSKPDVYTVSFSGGTGTPPSRPRSVDTLKTCLTREPEWKPGDNLTNPVIIKPTAVPNSDKMVNGQWLLLTATDQPDTDSIIFRCSSQNKCDTSILEKAYPEPVKWEWEILRGGGVFVTAAGAGTITEGGSVIYQPPLVSTAEETEVVIRLKVFNPRSGNPRSPGSSRMDPFKNANDLVIKYYRPGIRLEHPPLSWLPQDTNSVEINSKLMYRQNGEWRDGLAHMCRIHFFELLDVSRQKGVCMNEPVPNRVDSCSDLYLKKENRHDVFPPERPDRRCRIDGLYPLASTIAPSLSYAIKVHSRDFGAYGSFRSFATIQKEKDATPLYISIPVKRTDVTHPNRRPKKTEYADNRITVPHDIDENHIADGGWTVWGGGHVNDPEPNDQDEDNVPAGDGFNGDGLVNYEEYRGFRVLNVNRTDTHRRTSPVNKDIFIRNRDNLPLGLYTRITRLHVHEISERQYISDDDELRFVNFNFDPAMHDTLQRGLTLRRFNRASEVINRKTRQPLFRGTELEGLLGVAISMPQPPSTTLQISDLRPTRPNEQLAELIFTEKIAAVCIERRIDLNQKIESVTAHELLHGNNVCHHGEGDYRVPGEANRRQGLRSGNMDCVMRYANKDPIPGHPVEPIGSTLCTSPTGTGYNASNRNFGDAAAGRGNCAGQIRISGKGSPPKPCGEK